jgi:hypothetical protein
MLIRPREFHVAVTDVASSGWPATTTSESPVATVTLEIVSELASAVSRE